MDPREFCFQVYHKMQVRLTFVSVHPFVCGCFVAHVVGQVSLFRPREDAGGQALQGVVHGQAVVVRRCRENEKAGAALGKALTN